MFKIVTRQNAKPAERGFWPFQLAKKKLFMIRGTSTHYSDCKVADQNSLFKWTLIATTLAGAVVSMSGAIHQMSLRVSAASGSLRHCAPSAPFRVQSKSHTLSSKCRVTVTSKPNSDLSDSHPSHPLPAARQPEPEARCASRSPSRYTSPVPPRPGPCTAVRI